jgi:hypothetical protein
MTTRRNCHTDRAASSSSWHSHAHKIKEGLEANPRVPNMTEKPELEQLATGSESSAYTGEQIRCGRS